MRFLRLQQPHLLSPQETNATTDDIADSFNKQLLANKGLWTRHCGLVSFSPDINITQINVDVGEYTSRIIFGHVESPSTAFTSFYILVIYAPADSSYRVRHAFFNQLLQSAIFDPEQPLYSERLTITGDFNYNIHLDQHANRAPDQWRAIIQSRLLDCITDVTKEAPLPTFRRGDFFSSTLDFILATQTLHPILARASTQKICSEWSDHALLTAHWDLGTPPCGKGYWRGNPNLTRLKRFRHKLAVRLSDLQPRLEAHGTVQLQWDHLKEQPEQFIRDYNYQHSCWRTQQIKTLQYKRNKIFQSNPPPSILTVHLERIERQLDVLQRELVVEAALQASIRWREKGEISAGYLKRTAESRQSQKLLMSVMHPQTSAIVREPAEVQEAARVFYRQLYSPEPISKQALTYVHQAIPSSCRVSPTHCQRLVSDFSIKELQEGSQRSPRKSSPGMDGLPYEIWNLVLHHPRYRQLACAVYNEALQESRFPASWLQTSMCLLPKTGDLSSLKNWRPISLINTDAKIFTRLLNSRLIRAADTVINPFQTGFMMPGRFIATNGMLVKLAIEQTNNDTASSTIGLLLDQEKGYDRIHPTYLRQTMLQFGFPPSVVESISTLFFSTQIHININGNLCSPIDQGRGLRQGDPISPVLFNIALEPLLLRIMHDSSFVGFQPKCEPTFTLVPKPTPLKVLAYADDVFVFLDSPADLARLRVHLDQYQAASNARLNSHKTQAISLSGNPLPQWNAQLTAAGFPDCHDRTCANAVIYLGYPLATSPRQNNIFFDQLLTSVQTACDIHSHRQLSVRGRATILNTLILSRLWHVLRVVSAAPSTFFRKLKSICSNFMMTRMFPRIKYDTLCQPRAFGGVGLLDPLLQQNALQISWLEPLLNLSAHASYLTACLAHHLLTLSNTYTDPRFALVFPAIRPTAMRSPDKINTMLYRAIDSLQLDWSSAHLSAATFLHLPLNCIWAPLPGHDKIRRPGFSKLQVSHLFVFDHQLGYIRRRTPVDGIYHRILTTRFFTDLWEGRIYFLAGFAKVAIQPTAPGGGILGLIDAQPLHQYVQQQLPRWRTRAYKQLCAPPQHTVPQIVAKQWKQFWRWPMEHGARNLWYRTIHNSLPTAERLFRLGLQDLTSATCRLCNDAIDTPAHFLVLCRHRHSVWNLIWGQHYYTEPHTDRLIHFLQTLSWPDHHPPPTHHSHYAPTLIACTMGGIWSAYWQFIFHDTPYTIASVKRNINKALTRFRLADA